MDFETLLNELMDNEEKEKKMYMMRDFPSDEYYFLRLSNESKNLLDWLIYAGMLDARLFTMDEIETLEF